MQSRERKQAKHRCARFVALAGGAARTLTSDGEGRSLRLCSEDHREYICHTPRDALLRMSLRHAGGTVGASMMRALRCEPCDALLADGSAAPANRSSFVPMLVGLVGPLPRRQNPLREKETFSTPRDLSGDVAGDLFEARSRSSESRASVCGRTSRRGDGTPPGEEQDGRSEGVHA